MTIKMNPEQQAQATNPVEKVSKKISLTAKNAFAVTELLSGLEMYIQKNIESLDPNITEITIDMVIHCVQDVMAAINGLNVMNVQLFENPIQTAFFGKRKQIELRLRADQLCDGEAADSQIPFSHYLELRQNIEGNVASCIGHMRGMPDLFVAIPTSEVEHNLYFVGYAEAFRRITGSNIALTSSGPGLGFTRFQAAGGLYQQRFAQEAEGGSGKF